MFSSHGRQPGLAEPICLSLSAHRSGRGKNGRAETGAINLDNRNAGQRTSHATTIVAVEIRALSLRTRCERNVDLSPIYPRTATKIMTATATMTRKVSNPAQTTKQGRIDA